MLKNVTYDLEWLKKYNLNYFLVRLLNPSWSAFLILAFKWSNIFKDWIHIKNLCTFLNFPYQLIPILGTPVVGIHLLLQHVTKLLKCNRITFFLGCHGERMAKNSVPPFDEFFRTNSRKLRFFFYVLIDISGNRRATKTYNISF